MNDTCCVRQFKFMIILTGQTLLHCPIKLPNTFHFWMVREGIFLLHALSQSFRCNHAELTIQCKVINGNHIVGILNYALPFSIMQTLLQ